MTYFSRIISESALTQPECASLTDKTLAPEKGYYILLQFMIHLWRRIVHFIQFVKDSFKMCNIINLTDSISNGFTL